MDQNITYKEVEISLNRDFKFEATIGDEYKTFPSVAAAKKAIDKYQAKVFVPFEVLAIENNWGSGKRTFKKLRIVGSRIEKGRGRWNNDKVYFIDEKGETHRDSNTCFNVEDKAQLEEKYAELAAMNKEIELLEKKRDAFENSIDEKYDSSYELMAQAAGN